MYEEGRLVGVGVVIFRESSEGIQLLLGLRGDGQGWGLAGGKVDDGETPEQAAGRELQEEFGITHKGELLLLAKNPSVAVMHGVETDVLSYLYMASEGYNGLLAAAYREIKELRWVGLWSAEVELNDKIFQPTRESLRTVRKHFGGPVLIFKYSEDGIILSDFQAKAVVDNHVESVMQEGRSVVLHVATGNTFNYLRIAILKGVIPCSRVNVQFEGKFLSINTDGKMSQMWPKGFCDVEHQTIREIFRLQHDKRV